MSSARRAALFGVLLLAAGLRIAGLGWGLRHPPHPDEGIFLDDVALMIRSGDLDHRYYQYPGLFFYMLYPIVRFLPHEHPAALRLHRTTDPHLQLAVGGGRRIEIHGHAAGRDERTVDDEPERALLPVFAQQDDRMAEVGIHELRHGQEKAGRQRGRHLPGLGFLDDNAPATIRKSHRSGLTSV